MIDYDFFGRRLVLVAKVLAEPLVTGDAGATVRS